MAYEFAASALEYMDGAIATGVPDAVGATFMVWFQPKALPASLAINVGYVFVTGGSNRNLKIMLLPSGVVRGRVVQGSGAGATTDDAETTGTVTVDTWSLLGVRWTTSGDLSVFLDGEIVTNSSTAAAMDLAFNVINLAQGGAENINHYLAHVCYWDVALSDAEMQGLYEASEPSPSPIFVLPESTVFYSSLSDAENDPRHEFGYGGISLNSRSGVNYVDGPPITDPYYPTFTVDGGSRPEPVPDAVFIEGIGVRDPEVASHQYQPAHSLPLYTLPAAGSDLYAAFKGTQVIPGERIQYQAKVQPLETQAQESAIDWIPSLDSQPSQFDLERNSGFVANPFYDPPPDVEVPEIPLVSAEVPVQPILRVQDWYAYVPPPVLEPPIKLGWLVETNQPQFVEPGRENVAGSFFTEVPPPDAPYRWWFPVLDTQVFELPQPQDAPTTVEPLEPQIPDLGQVTAWFVDFSQPRLEVLRPQQWPSFFEPVQIPQPFDWMAQQTIDPIFPEAQQVQSVGGDVLTSADALAGFPMDWLQSTTTVHPHAAFAAEAEEHATVVATSPTKQDQPVIFDPSEFLSAGWIAIDRPRLWYDDENKTLWIARDRPRVWIAPQEEI